jgi:hypothetical protein
MISKIKNFLEDELIFKTRLQTFSNLITSTILFHLKFHIQIVIFKFFFDYKIYFC